MTPRDQAPRSLYAARLLTVVAAVAAYVDRATTKALAHHVREGYPAYTEARIDAAVTMWLVVLSVVAGVGIIGWSWIISVVRSGARWAPWAATATFALVTALALAALLVKDTSGETGLAPVLGWIGTVPCIAGLAAVTTLWRRSLAASASTSPDSLDSRTACSDHD